MGQDIVWSYIRQNQRRHRAVHNKLAHRVIDNKPVGYIGSVVNWRDLVHIREAEPIAHDSLANIVVTRQRSGQENAQDQLQQGSNQNMSGDQTAP